MGVQTYALSQEARDEYLEPLNDPSADGQRFFVQDLLDIAGYVPERIQIYQTLPNQARVFRVKLDSVNGGFVFVRWDKVKKENFIANKMIDPGVYYNLNAAKEIMRKQTDKANFTLDDLRAEVDLKNEEKRLEQEDAAAKQNSRRERKEKRKEKKDNTSELQ